jgi:hypothetical protein
MKKIFILAALAFACVGCTDFERATFNTLSSSKAVIDQTQADYESKTIPHTQCAYSLINNAKAAQTVAVDAFLDYESIKNAGKDVTAQTQVVSQDLVALAPLVVQVKSLVSNPTAACGGK